MERTPEELARQVFGERARFYTTSGTHSNARTLGRLVEVAQPQPAWRVLDLATGAGHAALALAPHVRAVQATDITPEMLAQGELLAAGRGITNVTFSLADAHDLPFPDRSFDLVTCRRAAHHFRDINLALAEMARVLRRPGRLVIDDRSVPDDEAVAALMNQLDRWHDQSHVREYGASEWQRVLADAGFTLEVGEGYTEHRPIGSLTDGVSEGEARLIAERLAAVSEHERQVLALEEVGGVLHLNHWYVLLGASIV